MSNKGLRVAISLVAVIAISNIISDRAWAEVVSMDGGGGSTYTPVKGKGGGGACSGYADNLDCAGWSWIYYKYTGGSDNTGKELYYTPFSSNLDDMVGVRTDGFTGVLISSECAKEGSGFWHLGRNQRGNKYNTFNINLDYTIGSSAYSYSTTKNYFGHHETYNIKYLRERFPSWGDDGAHDLKFQKSYGDEKLDHVLYIGSSSRARTEMYRADHYGTEEEVLQAYRDNDTSHGEMKDTTYAFCAKDGSVTETKQTYVGEVKLALAGDFIDEGDSVEIFKNDNTMHRTTSDTITISGRGKVTAQDETSEQSTNYTVQVTPDGGTQDFSANDEWNGPDSITMALIPGKVYEICSINSYSQEWSSLTGYSEKTSINACTKVTYEASCPDFNQTITNDNQKNYGRQELTVGAKWTAVGDANASGDNYSNQSEIWTTPGNSPVIRYYGCMGGQAGLDSGSGGTTTYNTSSDFGGIYTGETGSYSYVGSKGGNNILSTELGLTTPVSNWSVGDTDWQKRSGVAYSFRDSDALAQKSDIKTQVGTIYRNNFSWPRNADGSGIVDTNIDVRVPYNYVMNPDITDVTATNLVLGSEFKFDAKVSVGPRVNDKLSGTANQTTYKNDTKNLAWIFTFSPEISKDDFEEILSNNFSEIDGDYYYAGGANDTPMRFFNDASSKVGGDEGVSINANGAKTNLSYSIGESETIGTKICGITATWPADSHNQLSHNGVSDTRIYDGDDQSNALTKGVGTNPLWRFSISCATVGKKPNISIEGGSLTAGHDVNTARTSVKTGGSIKTFGSWAEYDIRAATAYNAGSGASLAYSGLQGMVNQNGDGGLSGGLLGVQTLGNLTEDYGLYDTSEASKYLTMSKKFVDSIYSNFYDSASNSFKDTDHIKFVGGPGQTITISSSDPQIAYNPNYITVYYGKAIEVNPDVHEINAILIATDNSNTGKLDTCAGVDRSPADGNMALLEHCNLDLIINGAVYADILDLKRVYGGGTINDGVVTAENMMPRAEIFNYDPRIIWTSYEWMTNQKVITETYIKEINPRY